MLSQILSSECFRISSLGFLFYLSVCPVLHIWSKILDLYFQVHTWHFNLDIVIYYIFHFFPFGAVLVKGGFFLVRHARKSEATFKYSLFSCAATALENIQEVLSIFNNPLRLLGLNLYEYKLQWFSISVILMVLTTCYNSLLVSTTL